MQGPAHTILHPKKRAFLAAFSRCGSISKAAKRAKIDRSTHYEWKREDPAYLKRYEEAIIEAGDALEDMLHEEAIDHKNITAAFFLLKGLRPDKYRERATLEHAGAVDVIKRVIGVDLEQT
jgi:hypothetical protein